MIAPALQKPIGLRAELEAALGGLRSQALVVELPAPIAAAHRLVDGAEEEAAYFEAHDQAVLVGLGAARSATASGPERFASVRTQLGPELEALVAAAGSGRLAGTPVALGGFSFEEELDVADPWSSFTAARMVIPKWLYRGEGRRASLTRVVEPYESARVVFAEYERLLDRLYGPEVLSPVSSQRISRGDESELEDRIEGARRLVRDRVMDKVVLAERRSYRLVGRASTGDVLARLGAPEAGAVRFAFRRGDRAFVGSTPERLVAKRGRTVETEAMAGSIVWDGVQTEQSLLESRKDLDEQGFVVRFVQDALEEVSSNVAVSEAPLIRRLAHVGHLVTQLVADVDPGLHLLDVARRLHPTPAVAGTPTVLALEHIRRHEGFSRGWYAGAVGWFDAAGDGELRVALRSGLIDGRHVHIFAGAGIVVDSVTAHEVREISSKHRQMRDAIGASA